LKPRVRRPLERLAAPFEVTRAFGFGELAVMP
jgi:hypothetical protein